MGNGWSRFVVRKKIAGRTSFEGGYSRALPQCLGVFIGPAKPRGVHRAGLARAHLRVGAGWAEAFRAKSVHLCNRVGSGFSITFLFFLTFVLTNSYSTNKTYSGRTWIIY